MSGWTDRLPPILIGVGLLGAALGAWAWLVPEARPDLDRAVAAAEVRRFDEARWLARDYLATDPDDPRANLLAAQFAINQDAARAAALAAPEPDRSLLEEALGHLDRTGQGNAGLLAYAALYRGKALARLGRLVEAESAWKEALRRDPLVPEAAWHLLEFYDLQGRAEEARRLALRQHEVEPNPRDRALYLVELLRQDAQPPAPESLIPVFEPFVRRTPGDFRAQATLGLALVRSGRIDDGLEALRVAVRARPDEPDAWIAWLTGLDEAGQIEALGKALERLPAEFAGSPRFATFAGRVALSRGNWSAAAGAYRRAFEAAPTDVALGFRLARALRNAGELVEAERLERAHREAQEAAGEVRSLFVEVDQAKTLGVAPHPSLCARVARLRERLGHPDEALAWYRMVLRDQPDDPESLAAVARL